MKQITVKIPDNKFNFFMELLKQLGITAQKEEEIPEIHKNIVRERIKKDDQYPENIQGWEEIQDNFKS